ncbi:MAG: flagellar type III secretion system protein FliQ [Planctomycetes bacterium]|nr:flagellar type III secretion system protein FliQ [Planctomycetota bacterium]
MHFDEQTVELVRDMLIVTLKISLPILMAGLIIGIIISLFQAITSIQDQTLAFVPKIVAMIVVAALLLPWIVARLIEYSRALFTMSP